ncbi:unnamed protein product [Adineta steineri]|uniref:Uncharacterized protein n=1 Tax=Adineta steineri TaxID=433720 RepID=A0A819E4L3_9BILA|nr:unnamed protein product [Adineta steineri]
MNDFSKRVNSIIVKNLPKDFNTNQLDNLFSQFGQIISSKVLPFTPNYEGGCGFVNFADAESCNQAVEKMNEFVVDGFTLRVSHSASRNGNNNSDRPQNGFRSFGQSFNRTTSATAVNPEETNGTLSPGVNARFSGFRSPSATQFKPMTADSTHSSTNELNGTPQSNKPLWNSNSGQQTPLLSNNKSPFQNGTSNVNQQINIQEHEPLVVNKTYNVYLSNLEVPNIIFAATLDDYVNATLLITQMNKHEQLSKVQANSYKSKLAVGQACAALFNGDWYRARVLETGENRVRVQYIDWGNSGWCDSILEIRPLPNEYYKDPALCVKCILDGIPSNEKLSQEQTNNILGILVLDLKLEMTVLRIENGFPVVRLNLDERNLNNEILSIFSSSSNIIKQNPIINFDSSKPDINLSEMHHVQLTTVDAQSECFHVLLMRDCLPTIMNILKDWNANKQPLTVQPKSDTLICAQYDADNLWYRAWIESVTENGCRVYFVDFGNEEIVSSDRISECPDILKTIPWQSVQIKLANIKLTDDERDTLLRDFESERLEMKIIQKNQDIYLVDLLQNGKSLADHILELRKKEQQQITPKPTEVPKVSVEPIQQTLPKTPVPISKTKTESFPQTANEISRTISQAVQPIVDLLQRPPTLNNNQIFQSGITKTPIITDTSKKPLFSSSNTTPKQVLSSEKDNDTSVNDNLTILITEQRRQNRLLEQVIAAINTTNSLLTQLVQR